MGRIGILVALSGAACSTPEAPACSTSGDCPDSYVCRDSACVLPCVSDRDCSRVEVCHTGACVLGERPGGDSTPAGGDAAPGGDPSTGAGDANGGGDTAVVPGDTLLPGDAASGGDTVFVPGDVGPIVGCPFVQQASGLVVMEVEHAQARIAGAQHTWQVDTSFGFSGDGALRAEPNIGTEYDTFNAASPRLDFDVVFTSSGTHYVWARWIGERGDDSLYAGVGGGAPIRTPLPGPLYHAWRWVSFVGTVAVPATGEQRVSLWMREDGVQVDQLLLTTNASFVPATALPETRPPSCAAAPSFRTLADDFDDGSLAGSWNAAVDSGAALTYADGQLRLQSPHNDIGYVTISTADRYDLRGAYASVRLVESGDIANAPPYNAVFRLQIELSNFIGFIIEYNELRTRRQIDGVFENIDRVPYDPAQMQYLRIGESEGSITFDSSPTGDVWTPVSRIPTPFPVDALKAVIANGNWQATATTSAIFDDVNVAHDVYQTFPVDPNCQVGIVNGELRASIAGAAEDTAFGTRDFGPVSGRLFVRSRIRGVPGAVHDGPATLLEVTDTAGTALFALDVEPTLDLVLYAAAGAIDDLGVSVGVGKLPADGASVTVEVMYERGHHIVVQIDGAESWRRDSLSGATTQAARRLNAGIIRAWGWNRSLVMHHDRVAVSTTGWLGP